MQTSWTPGSIPTSQLKEQCEAYSDFAGQFCEVLLLRVFLLCGFFCSRSRSRARWRARARARQLVLAGATVANGCER